MRADARWIAGLAGCTLILGGCSERSTPASLDESLVAFAPTAGCDLVKNFSSQYRSFLGNPLPKPVTDGVRDLGDACSAGNQTLTSSIAWQLVADLQTRLGQQITGDPAIGSQIANGLLACTSSLCLSATLPGINFSHSFGPSGLFSVHAGDTNPAIARGLVNFVDFNGAAATALWGVEVTAPWSVVTATSPVLVYGGPVLQGGIALQELSIGNLQYRFDVFPDAGEFVGNDLHVGVCFSADVTLPPSAQGLEARLRREGVLLEEHTPGFCPASAAQASILAPVFSLVSRFLPASLTRARIDTKVRVVGGTPLDFSRFAAIAAKVDGQLTMVTPPIQSPVENQSIGTIRVMATSGDGTPMEKVQVTLYLVGNYGVPAGASIAGDLVSFTQEGNNALGIATFPDDGPPVTIGKPGGYRVCATASFDGFTFPDVCSDVINVKNAT